MTATHIKYPSIVTIDKIAPFLRGQDVYVQEKLDGSNCAVQLFPDGSTVYQSRTQILDPTSPNLGQFKRFIDAFERRRAHDSLLRPSYLPVVLFGETLNTNKLTYEQNEPFVLFDVFGLHDGSFGDIPSYLALVQEWARALEMPSAPILYQGKFDEVEQSLSELIGPSKFDSRSDFIAEGVVVKALHVERWWTDRESGETFTVTDPWMAGKVVSAPFKEVRNKPTALHKINDPLLAIAKTFVTPARFDKIWAQAVEKGYDPTQAHFLIGLMTKDVAKEAKEDVADLLYKAFAKDVNRKIAELTLALHAEATSPGEKAA